MQGLFGLVVHLQRQEVRQESRQAGSEPDPGSVWGPSGVPRDIEAVG